MSDAPFISSDPNAFLRSYWKALHDQSSFFPNLAPELQATALADAIEADYPTKAAEIRQWNPTTRRAMLACLDQALIERHTDKTTELWTMQKGTRQVQCVAVYTSVGVDLRLLEANMIQTSDMMMLVSSTSPAANVRRSAN